MKLQAWKQEINDGEKAVLTEEHTYVVGRYIFFFLCLCVHLLRIPFH
jgi:hypothetical protein